MGFRARQVDHETHCFSESENDRLSLLPGGCDE